MKGGPDMAAVLEVGQLDMNFGGLKALHKVDLQVDRGEIVAVIGPNGAGKTTIFNCLTGFYRPAGGDIIIAPPGQRKRRINGLNTHQVTRLGLARTFQNIRLFPRMTVLENVMVARHCRTRAGFISAVFRNHKTRHEEGEIVDRSYGILEKMGLDDAVNVLAENLPYGAQRRLEIARALATEPFLLLLDEPAAGMNPQETKELEILIRQIRRDENISILLIEHDMKLVMSLCDRICVMDYGEKIAEGAPAAVRDNPAVIRAYLGEDEA
jgi:branched-chain amino acid transport system ATP-binding protein